MVRREDALTGIAYVFFLASASYGQAVQTIVLAPVDLAATETAQVSIVSSASGYPGGTFLTTCQAAVSFHGADGSVLGTPATFTIGQLPQVFSTQLPYASVGANVGRAFVSAQIALTPGSFAVSALSPPIPPCAVSFSLSTYDTATGVTQELVVGEAAGTVEAVVGGASLLPCVGDIVLCNLYYQFSPSQVIVLPPVNLAASETVEIGIVSSAAGYSESPGACSGSIAFYGADGSVIGVPTAFNIDKRPLIFSAQLPYVATGANAPSRAVSAQIALTASPNTVAYLSATPPCVVAFSMKTFDTATGATHAFVTGQSTLPAANAAAAGVVPTVPEHRALPAPGHGLGK